jgi:hypothetical protein
LSINLVSLAMQVLTPDMIARIASRLGVNQSMVGKAITAAVPTLLGSLAGVASSPQGAKSLFETIGKQPSGLLENLAGTLGGAGHDSLVQAGTSALGSLLGGSSTAALTGAIEKYAGLSSGTGSSLLGMLTPVVLGTLGKQVTSGGLDAAGLAGLLSAQKTNISAALPGDFAKLVGGTGLLDSLGANVAGASQAAVQTSQAAAKSAASSASSGLPGWVSWALPAIAVLALGWWFLKPAPQTVAEQAKQAAGQATQAAQSAADQATQAAKNAAAQATQTVKDAAGQATQAAQGAVDKAKQAAAQAVQSAQNLTVGSVDLGAALQKNVTSLRDALSGVTDAASAQLALPKLQDAVTQFDKLGSMTGELPATGKSALAALVAAARPSIDDLFNKVLAIPGVADLARPTIDQLRAKLDGLAKSAG